MSDFIYNDNLNNNDDDKEPIQFYFGNEKSKKGFSTTFLILICAFCVILSATLGALGGVLITSSMNDEPTKSGNTIADKFHSPYETIATNNDRGTANRTEIIAAIKDTVVEVRTQYVISDKYFTQSGAGSGVIVGSFKTTNEETGEVTEQGYHIITNAHVIEQAVNSNNSNITVTLTDGTVYNAELVGSDAVGDIAILKILEEKKLPCATFANKNYKLSVGEDIIAIGNPLGQLGGTVTNGYVSALDREIEVDGIDMNLLQIDAPINPGNSGGGLFNLRGELVGIVNAKSMGKDIEGLGFAIPSNDAAKIYEEFIELGYVTDRPTIFVEYNMVGLYREGVYVSKVLERSTGDNSDSLLLHDHIYGICVDGEDYLISTAAELNAIINKADIGSKLELLVRRDGTHYRRVTVTVYEYYR